MKISKKRLANKVRKLEVQNYDMRQKIKKMDELLTYIDGLTTELNHALPDPEYDAKCEAAAAGVEVSLDGHRERLGLDKPQLKQLDQSVFDGLDEKWRWAAVNELGILMLSMGKMVNIDGCWVRQLSSDELFGKERGYDTTDWKESLIERDNAELTGSDLCRYLKSRKHWVLAVVSDENDATAEFHQTAAVVTGIASDGGFICGDKVWQYAVPIDHKGEPLTAKEVGL